MLSEKDRAILYESVELLVHDFDPEDSIIFLEVHDILTRSQCEKIEKQPSRLEKLRELLRAYSRRAESLLPLIQYFDYNLQFHLCDFLNEKLKAAKEVENNRHFPDVPNPKAVVPLKKEKRLSLLLDGQVPAIRNACVREGITKQIADALRSNSKLDSSFTVLHGMAGIGKTYAAAQTLMDDPYLIGVNFHHVYYLDDSRVTPNQIKHLMTDLLLMLSDQVVFNLPHVKDLSTVALMKLLREALIDKPYTLVFVDDVRSAETVRWLDQLGLNVLATARNIEIFDSVSSHISIIPLQGFKNNEVATYLDKFLTLYRLEMNSDAFVRLAADFSSGNPAVLSKLVKLSNGSCERFKDYCAMMLKNSLKCLNCITTYRFNDIEDAIHASIVLLEDYEKDIIMRTASLKFDVPIPLTEWCDVVPVELCRRTSEIREVYDRLSRIHKKTFLLDESDDHSYFTVKRLTFLYATSMLNNNDQQ
ncbi:unnamed protein product [Auanema sp. JU1783]|nr:unnamed protein product [Auanema sp. JU1783]